MPLYTRHRPAIHPCVRIARDGAPRWFGLTSDRTRRFQGTYYVDNSPEIQYSGTWATYAKIAGLGLQEELDVIKPLRRVLHPVPAFAR